MNASRRGLRGRLGGAWRRTTRRRSHVLLPGDATVRAPHVRMDTDLLRLQGTLLAALLPSLAAGLVVTGHHACTALAAAGLQRLPGTRGDVLEALGCPVDAGAALSCALHGVVLLAPQAAAALAAAYAVAVAFARARDRRPVPGTAAAALIFALLLPAATPAWAAALAMAFGVLVGREIFGGVGRTFVHPAVVGLVFLGAAFPGALRHGGALPGGPVDIAAIARGGTAALDDASIGWWDAFVGLDPGPVGATSALAALLGAAFLVHRRAASWRVMLGAVAGMAVAAALLPEGPSYPGVAWTWHLTLGSFAFAVVFVATDPGSGAHTNPGRWLHGAVAGALVMVIRVASPAQAEGTLPALLLGSVVVPLIDHGVVAWHVRRRRRRTRRAAA